MLAHGTPDQRVSNPVQPSLAIIIAIIPIMFSVTILMVAYGKFCNTTRPVLSGPRHTFPELVRSRSRCSGIDKAVIETLPFFRLSSLKGSREGLECSVCLSKFEDSEVLRLLPMCRHAFHMDCIDKWLESHCSCPLCRYKFEVWELTSFNYTNSLRYSRNPSNLPEDPSLELSVQREEDHQSSSRVKMANSFQSFPKPKKEDFVIQEGDMQKLLHKFNHKIFISDIVYKSRWSDVNPSDLMLLKSEMLNIILSKRLSPLNSSVEFHHGFSMNEQIVKIKEALDRKRLYEFKVGKINMSYSISTSSFPLDSKNEGNQTASSRLLIPAQNRSLSEITNISRFTEFRTKKQDHRRK